MNENQMPLEALEALERQKTLFEISRLYNPDFQRIWELITERAAHILSSNRTSIWSLSDDGLKLICKDLFVTSSSEHMGDIELESVQVPAYFRALETSRYIDASDGINDPRTSEFTTGYLDPLNIKSLLDVPIRKEGKLSGVVCFEYTDKIHTITIEEKEFAASLADLISAKFETQERNRTENELLLSENRYRNILENALVGIFRTKPDGSFVFGNPALATILEFDSVEEMLQANVNLLYHDIHDRDRLIDQIRRNRKITDFSLILVSNKGNMKNCIISAYMEDEEIVGMMMDVTEQHAINKDLEEARLRAEESDRLKTSLLANMSHELRTPMNSILGFSELLMSDSDDDVTQFYSSKIHTAGKRLMNTLQTILELADMETTRSKLLLKEVHLLYVLSSVLPPFQSQAKEKGLYLLAEMDSTFVAMADENLLKLVFQNLIDNAIKFTDSGGVTIGSSLKNFDGRNWALIQFKDTGIGIASVYFEQIFQEFRQASEGYNRHYEGTGLGLTLSSKMINLMGGRITVESEVGHGSQFTVWLPGLANGKEPKETIVPPSEIPDAAKIPKRLVNSETPLILVIEDNDDNAELVKLYLKAEYQIDRAPDSSTALKMAENKQYKVILLDINLGLGMDGLQIVQTLRSQKSYQNIPIIAITGYTMAEDREKIMKAGCTHYIAKPFTKSIILNEMSKALKTNT